MMSEVEVILSVLLKAKALDQPPRLLVLSNDCVADAETNRAGAQKLYPSICQAASKPVGGKSPISAPV
jgi:hypothetical protein